MMVLTNPNYNIEDCEFSELYDAGWRYAVFQTYNNLPAKTQSDFSNSYENEFWFNGYNDYMESIV
jgi:hypothetical protein